MITLVLNSAHGKYPRGRDPWVTATVGAVEEIRRAGDICLCSTGPLQWDLTAYLFGRAGVDIELIVNGRDDDEGFTEFERLSDELALNVGSTVPLFTGEAPDPRHPKTAWQARDRFAVSRADRLCPVSIRPGGRLAGLIAGARHTVTVHELHLVEWVAGRSPAANRPPGGAGTDLPGRDWLVHWTRSSQGPWPGEPRWWFFRDMLAEPDRYVRDAASTLARILREERIRGSSWKVAGGLRAVAFTAATVTDSVGLMRWRRRFSRFTFEPYGIAISRQVLEHLGAQPVRYMDGDTVRDPYERLFLHAPGEGGAWRMEREWRVPGDVPLDGIEARDIRILCPDVNAGDDVLNRAGRDVSVHPVFR